MPQTIQAQIDGLVSHLDRQRSTVFDVTVSSVDATLLLQGAVLERTQHAAVLKLAHSHASGAVRDELVILLESHQYDWAVVRWSVADVRAQPTRAAELISEASYGESVEVLRNQGGWSQIRQSDGYIGWISQHGLCPGAARYRDEATHVIAARWRPLVGLEGSQVGLLPWGIALPVLEFRDGLAFFMSPDGLPCTIEADALIQIEDRPAQTSAGVSEMLAQISQFIGVPYLWGGTTPYGFDCSGLAQAAYRWMGLPLPRDADQQAQQGTEVTRDALQAGDLLFWAVNRNNEQRTQNINHVSIALDGEQMIHANQYHWGVSIDRIAEVQSRYEVNDDPGLVAIRRLVE
ncbi:MAG: C40 family peptidase [Herpetosiphonaceae bacterium]|nr:C40 family peptidase [Herpetosiphonaceae bacterium]